MRTQLSDEIAVTWHSADVSFSNLILTLFQ